VALRHPAVALLALATVIVAPSLATGVVISHSSAHNLLWAGQFAEQFRSGVLYPRWMPDSFDGLGSPAFYFYSPLPFWIDAVLSALTFDAMQVPYRLGVVSLLILWASGLAMHAWLSSLIGRPRAALIGAMAYMVAPYHLLDHYERGALAELAGYALLPLVMLSISRIAQRRAMTGPLLALSYAGLLMTHLPTSLLVSVTLIPGYVLFRAWRLPTRGDAMRLVAIAAAGGLLGVTLAAIYLVPALALQDWISSDQFWKFGYRPEDWFLIAPERWPDQPMMLIISAECLAVALMCAGLCVIAIRIAGDHPARFELGFWTVSCIVCVLLVSGLVPWFWDLPFLAKVQFPWRLMILIEFAAVTALCLAPFAGLPRGVAYIFLVAAGALAPAVLMTAQAAAKHVETTWKAGALARRDVKEYEPRGYPQTDSQGHTDLGLEPLTDVPSIACTPAARLCLAQDERFGAMRVEVEAYGPTVVVLRRFFFPAWHIEGDVPLVATEPLRLVSFAVPLGRTEVTLQRVTLPVEKWGWAISGLSLALLLAWAAAVWRRIRVA